MMTTEREILEYARLIEMLHYNKDTGDFTWLKSNSNRVKIGSMACKSLNSDGYSELQIDGVRYKSHRLAWFYCNKVWPNQIDHINGIRSDNRIENLRNVCGAINTHNQRLAHKNNKTGLLGVTIIKSGKYLADIRVCGKKKHIGHFDTKEEAHAAYVSAKRNLHEGNTL